MKEAGVTMLDGWAYAFRGTIYCDSCIALAALLEELGSAIFCLSACTPKRTVHCSGILQVLAGVAMRGRGPERVSGCS